MVQISASYLLPVRSNIKQTFIVHEEHSKVSLWAVVIHQQCTVHVSVAPRLGHESPAEPVKVVTDEATLLKDCCSTDDGVAWGREQSRDTPWDQWSAVC